MGDIAALAAPTKRSRITEADTKVLITNLLQILAETDGRDALAEAQQVDRTTNATVGMGLRQPPNLLRLPASSAARSRSISADFFAALPSPKNGASCHRTLLQFLQQSHAFKSKKGWPLANPVPKRHPLQRLSRTIAEL